MSTGSIVAFYSSSQSRMRRGFSILVVGYSAPTQSDIRDDLVLSLSEVPITIIGVILMDKSGRRPLLIVSATGTFIGCFLAAVSFYLKGCLLDFWRISIAVNLESSNWISGFLDPIQFTGLLKIVRLLEKADWGRSREFTHRVKSISMAKFTSQEVHALQGGGNERAREIYFKEWDPQRHSFPDSRECYLHSSLHFSYVSV
ncbi:hypothetical protein J5N97_017316 [Dioscorea zingiberensis]|uniref:Uncharacterized protein n=1 Tax=Dioscorea zingiberensis TaxID=325984 RepID=A0A9D5CKY9_9LILI|nr:hypothetical protein J5N97_017316 [Dioscorea zingiberensis]